MLPKHHFLLGLVFSFIILLIFPQIRFMGALLILLSSFLIDVDHYIYYVCKKRDLNLRRAYLWFIERDKKILKLNKEQRINVSEIFCFLHGAEMLIILYLLGIFVHQYFLFVFIGITFHIFLDVLNTILYSTSFARFSLLYTFLNNKE